MCITVMGLGGAGCPVEMQAYLVKSFRTGGVEQALRGLSVSARVA